MAKYILFTFCLISFAPLLVEAQINSGGLVQQASIILEPTYPAPHSTFSAKIDDYALTSQTTSISWKINGSTTADTNQRKIEIEAGEAGKPITIEATLGLNGNQSLVLKKTITPVYLDIIVEPQTRTPAFYLGRGLPSIDSRVNLKAILSGINIPTKDLVYSWQVNDRYLEGGPLRARNSASITVPRGSYFLVSLKITNLAGEELIKQTLRLPSVKPEIHFYEKSALYGINPKSLESLSLTGNSATITAEPYYLDKETYNEPSILEWTVDGKKSAIPADNPYEITLARPAGEGRGVSKIEFHVRSLAQLLQGAEGALRINF
jgi:hypothetical protein